MRLRPLLLSLVLVGLASPLFARDKVDVLVMNNGDRMTCEIKGLEAGVLYVSFDYIDGTTSVDWSKVARLESTQMFVVKTADGSAYEGALRTMKTSVDRPIQIQVLESTGQNYTMNSAQVVRMVATSDKFWQRFNGEISFGTIYSKGNESTQYSLGASTAYVRERWNAGGAYDSNFSSNTGATAVTRNSLALTAFHLMPQKNWFYGGINNYLQSSEQGISLQTVLGGGLGRYLKNTNRMTIQLLGGVAWQDTSYETSKVPIANENTVAALIYGRVSFFKFSKTNFDATASVLPSLSDPGRVRINTNLAYYVKIVGDLKWNMSFYGNWDNQPPPGLSGSDYGTTAGLSWTYGLK